MEKKTHTPGPWRVLRYRTTTGKTQTLISQSPGKHVCRMDVATRNDRTLEADSNLIAAAPELLAVAEGFVALYFSTPCTGLWKEYEWKLYEKALLALKKARGEANTPAPPPPVVPTPGERG